MDLKLVQTVTIVALAAFALIMAAIGIYSWKKTQTLEGFLIGGRNIGPWFSAFSYGTSYFSAVIFVGYAGKHGWDIGVGSLWIGIGNALLGCLLAWKLLARKTRTMTHTISAKTMPEFFEGRYSSKALKVVAALIIFIFLVPYSAAVYKGLGNMFVTVFPDVPVNTWMLFMALLTALYLFMGGYVAAAYADFIQGCIMIFGICAMIIAVMANEKVGGLSGLITNLAQVTDNGDGITGEQLTNIFGGSSWRFLAFNIMLTSFGTWGLPQMVNKYYGIKDEKSIKIATIVSTVFCAIIGIGAYTVGSCSRLVLDNVMPAGGHDAVIPAVLTAALGGSVATVLIFAVLLLLLLSASMSTLEAVVLSSSSAISVDLIPTIKKSIPAKTQVLITRALCILFVALSYIFATQNFTIIVNIMSFSWGIVAGSFIGPYVWGVNSKKITKAGAVCGMASGFLTVVISTIVLTSMNMSDGLEAMAAFKAASASAPEMGVSAMAVSLVVTPLVSMFTKKFDDEFINSVFANN